MHSSQSPFKGANQWWFDPVWDWTWLYYSWWKEVGRFHTQEPKIYWPMRIKNEEFRRRAGNGETISDQVARRRCTWPGHVLRMDCWLTSTHYPHLVPRGEKEAGSTTKNKVEREIKDRGLMSRTEAATAPQRPELPGRREHAAQFPTGGPMALMMMMYYSFHICHSS